MSKKPIGIDSQIAWLKTSTEPGVAFNVTTKKGDHAKQMLVAILASVEQLKYMNEAFVEYTVTCARCGKRFSTKDATPEEGDEWECYPCNDRENERERLNIRNANHQS